MTALARARRHRLAPVLLMLLALLAVADAMEPRSLPFEAALQALATLIHRIALAQYAPTAIADELERVRSVSYAAAFAAEYVAGFKYAGTNGKYFQVIYVDAAGKIRGTANVAIATTIA